jgi:phenylacetate-CoA ligase
VYDRTGETLDPERLRAHQWHRLRTLVDEVIGPNPFWTARWRAAGLATAEDLREWKDFARLPLTTKAELVTDQSAHPPFGTNLTYPSRALRRVHQTSGTSGAPLRWLETQASWEWWARCWGFVLAGAGVRPDDRVVLSVLVRALHRLLGRLRGGAGAGRAGDPGRRPGFTDAPGGHGIARRDGARLHALVRAAPPAGGA